MNAVQHRPRTPSIQPRTQDGDEEMSTRRHSRLRAGLTALVLVAELAHLAWEHLHGGIVTHHLLTRADLPAISNAWGVVLLPALTWFTSGRVARRVTRHSRGEGTASRLPPGLITGFVGSLVIGIVLSAAFSNGYETVASSLFLGMFVLAVLLRVYRPESLLGFVLGMTFAFGAVLPMLIGSLVAAISAVVHLGIRPLLVRLWTRFRPGVGREHGSVDDDSLGSRS
jgi:hypothetical protein